MSIMGHFNLEPTETTINSFIQQPKFYNLIKLKTCLNPKSGTCTYINLILTKVFLELMDPLKQG